MIGLCIKSTNLVTKNIIFEGIKKTYATYDEATEEMRKSLHNPNNRDITSHQIPHEFGWACHGRHCYISSKSGNCRTTIYLIRI